MGAIGDSYVTLEEIKTYIHAGSEQKDQVTRYDALMVEAAASVSREIERITERQFNRDEVASEREYGEESIRSYRDKRGVLRYEVLVDDFYTTDDLVVDVDGTEVTDFKLYPRGGRMNGVPGWPYWQIQHSSIAPTSTVTVTARWGWDAVPADIKEAVKICASETYQLKSAQFGVIGTSESGFIMRMRDNQMAMSKINRFRRKVAHFG